MKIESCPRTPYNFLVTTKAVAMPSISYFPGNLAVGPTRHFLSLVWWAAKLILESRDRL